VSWIQPNGSIWLLRGVDIDSEYNHTYYFPNLAAQTSFFSNIAATRGRKFEQQSYQRTNRGWLKVNCSYDEVCTYNYLMFNNQRFGGKWFYAFIDSAEYVNEHCTEISYTIDVMQTWYFDYELGQCFVEREHTSTDIVGEHVIPEPINGGTFTVKKYDRVKFADKYDTGDVQWVWMMATIPEDNTSASRTHHIYNGAYQPYRFLFKPITGNGTAADAARIKDIIADLVARNDTIVYSRIVPAFLFGALANDPDGGVFMGTDGNWVRNEQHNFTRSNAFAPNSPGASVGYVPKNKKLYTAQYNHISVSNNTGSTTEYSWEKFSGYPNNSANFTIRGAFVPNPTIVCYPTNYDGVLQNFDTSLPFDQFPEIPWSEDGYSRWWAQNKESFALQTLGSVIGIAGGIASGQYWLAAGSAISAAQIMKGSRSKNADFVGGKTAAIGSGIRSGDFSDVPRMGRQQAARADILAQQYNRASTANKIAGGIKALGAITDSLSVLASASHKPSVNGGASGNSGLLLVDNAIGYTFYDVGVCAEEAEIIDKYFDMFGYQVNAVKVPNIKGGGRIRPSWNYVKTSQCIVHATASSGVPQDDEDEIENVYNSGITFWNPSVQVGDYSANNLPA